MALKQEIFERFKWLNLTFIPIIIQLLSTKLVLPSACCSSKRSFHPGSISFQQGSVLPSRQSVTMLTPSSNKDKVLLQRDGHEDSVISD